MGNTATVDYDALAKQHGGTEVIDYDALAKQHGGQLITDTAQSGPMNALKAYAGQAWDAVKGGVEEMATGAAKSAVQPVATVSKALNKIPVVGETLAPSEGVNAFDQATMPSNVPQKIGAGVEQAGEMMAGEGIVKNMLTHFPMLAKFPRLLNVISSTITSGTDAAAHGENPVAPAAVAGTMTGAAEALPAIVPALKSAAESQYGKVLAPTTKENKAIAQRVIPELLDRRVTALTQNRLVDQVEAAKEASGQAVNDVINRVVDEGSNIRPGQKALPPYNPEIQTGVQRVTGEGGPTVQRADGTAVTNEFPQRTQFESGSAHPEMSGQTSNPGTFSSSDPKANATTLSALQKIAADPEHFNSFSPTEQQAIKDQIDRLKAVVPTGKPITSGPIMSTQPIADHLESLKGNFSVNGSPVNQQAIDNLSKVQDIVKGVGDNVSLQSMRRLRQILDDEVAQGKGFFGKTLSEGSLLDTKKEAADAIRREFANTNPDIAKVNGEYSFWSNVGKVLNDTAQRKTGQAGGLLPAIAEGAGIAGGAAKGGLAGAAGGGLMMGLAKKAMQSTYWRTTSAVNKARLADAIAGGNIAKVNFYVSKILAGESASASATNESQSQ